MSECNLIHYKPFANIQSHCHISTNKENYNLCLHTLQNIFTFPMVLEEETKQKPGIISEETKRKGKFPFLTSEIIGNCAFPQSFHEENSREILMCFVVIMKETHISICMKMRVNTQPRAQGPLR